MLLGIVGFVAGGHSAGEMTREAHNSVYDYKLVNTKRRKKQTKNNSVNTEAVWRPSGRFKGSGKGRWVVTDFVRGCVTLDRSVTTSSQARNGIYLRPDRRYQMVKKTRKLYIPRYLSARGGHGAIRWKQEWALVVLLPSNSSVTCPSAPVSTNVFFFGFCNCFVSTVWPVVIDRIVRLRSR